MRLPRPNAESTALFLIASGLFTLGVSDVHLRLLDPVDNAYLWKRSGVLATLLISYGTVLFVLALTSYLLSLRGRSFFAQLSRHAREAAAVLRNAILPSLWHSLTSRRNLSWLLAVFGIGIAVRAYFLSQPMRYDEAYTFLNFVNANLTRVFNYPLPNNHVLHTILVKFTTLLWEPHPESIRLPAFLAGAASIPLMFCVCRKLLHGRSGAFATVAIAVFPYLVLYSTMARGYSIVVFLTLALIFVGAHILKIPSIAASAVLSSIGALGLLTMPSMAFPIASIYLWLAFLLFLNGYGLNRILRNFVFPCVLMTVGFSAVLYTPVIFVTNSLQSLIANEFVRAQPSPTFFGEAYPHFALTLAHYSRDIPGLVLFFFLILIVTGIYGAARMQNWPILLVLPAVAVASGSIFFLKHAIPFPRTWIYVIPIVLLIADAGFTYCIEKLSHRFQVLAQHGMVLAGGLSAIFLISTNAIMKYPDTGVFPEAPMVARYLKAVMSAGDTVYAMVPADYPTYFYLWHHGLRDFAAKQNTETGGTGKSKFFVVKKSSYSVEDAVQEHEDAATREEIVKLIEVDDAAVYRDDAPE